MIFFFFAEILYTKKFFIFVLEGCSSTTFRRAETQYFIYLEREGRTGEILWNTDFYLLKLELFKIILTGFVG